MNDSWSIIEKILGWANVVLEEVQVAMVQSDELPDLVKNDVAEAKQAVQRLVEYERQALEQASTNIQYQELVRKLQAQDMPITSEEWQRAKRLDV